MVAACVRMLEVAGSGLTQEIWCASRVSFTVLREAAGSLGMVMLRRASSTSASFSLRLQRKEGCNDRDTMVNPTTVIVAEAMVV